MGKAWKQWSEDELASEAQRGWGQGATIEAMHRLRESLNRLRVSNDRSSRLIFALTIVLIIFTVEQVIPLLMRATPFVVQAIDAVQKWIR